MILQELRRLVEKTTDTILESKGKKVSLPVFDISVPPSKIKGDLASNLPLMVAKQVGQAPRQLAEDIIKGFPGNELIDRIEVAGPGFLNFLMKDAAFGSELEDLLTGKTKAQTSLFANQKLLLEFVSANPTGPLHVGHGRGAALGDSLVRILRYLGINVETEFYINDAGGQIRNLGLSMEARLKELKGEKAEFPEGGYKGEYVIDLAKEVQSTSRPFKPVESAQMVFSEEDLAGFASKRILKRIQEDLKEFGVQFDHWFSETSLHASASVQNLLDDLKKKGHVYEQEGALWFRASDFGDDKDRVLKKANEAPTYFASDIAYHCEKFKRKFNLLVNIWGADHHGYAQRLKGAMKALDKNPDDLMIILNQMISIKGGKLSKRAGNIITLRELVDEVGRDATRFFFALRSPGSHFEFDLDLAKKKASENPVYYVQYVHARCCSIFAEADKRKMKTAPLEWKKKGLSHPLEDVEKDVILHLLSFDRTVEMCARDMSNHHLPVYLMELAGKYHSFYEKCRVLEDDVSIRSFRLDLVEAIRKRVAQGLDLLGVSAPERL